MNSLCAVCLCQQNTSFLQISGTLTFHHDCMVVLQAALSLEWKIKTNFWKCRICYLKLPISCSVWVSKFQFFSNYTMILEETVCDLRFQLHIPKFLILKQPTWVHVGCDSLSTFMLFIQNLFLAFSLWCKLISLTICYISV